jgi:hypothetical protein
MLWWVIKITILSCILILLVHNVFHFLKTSLTVPKIKDLVNTTPQKYKDIYDIIHQKRSDNINRTDEEIEINSREKSSMKNELKDFLKKQMQELNMDVVDESIADENNIIIK